MEVWGRKPVKLRGHAMGKPTLDQLKKRIRELEKAAAAHERVQNALRASEEKYRTLTENINVGIFRSTPGSRGNLLEANPALVRMLGYRRKQELFVKDVAEIYQNPKDRLAFSKRMTKNGFVKNAEFRLVKKDGTPIIVSETAQAVRDERGRVLYFDGIIEDITERKRAEEDVLIQKAYFERLFNSAPEAIALHDNNDIVLDVNDEFTKLFRYSRNEAIGRPINELVASASYQGEAAALSAQLIQGKRVEVDSRRKRKDGTLVDVSILGAPIVRDGKQMGVYAIYRDITERKKAEEELLLQKTYLESLFNSAPEAIALHDSDGLIVNVNEEFKRVFGYTHDEALGKPVDALVASEEYRAEAGAVSDRVLHGERIEFDSKRKRKDGTLLDVSVLGAPIIHAGRQIGDYAIYRDITQRKKAEEEILVQKAYHEKLFNSAPEAIVLHSNDDIVVNVNDEFTRLFGYSRDEAIGKPINELVASKDFREEAATLSSQVIRGKRVEVDSRRRRKDGTLVDVSILGAPIFHGDTQMGVYAIYRDITERKRAEEARLRATEEARMARHIQMNLLPKSNPEVPGYEISGRNVPALNVGGDYFDFIWLDDHRLAIAIGDVSGNGLAASLVMANLQATIRGQALFATDPKDCLERANKLLFRSTDVRTFVSLFYGILDIRAHTLEYASAGQDMPILFSEGAGPVTLQTRGIVLGVKEDAAYVREVISISPNDRLLIYTDGICEAMNERMEEFGEERLTEIVRRNDRAPVGELVDTILGAVNNHVGDAAEGDDMTLILLKRRGSS
jgi:PAS domain S-box-containing protein